MFLYLLIFQKQSGPPDLDEMIRRMFKNWNSKRSKLDAFSRNGGNGGGPELSFSPAKVLAIGSLVVVALVFLSGFYTVDQSERAVTFRFGQPVGVSQPGLRWLVPFVEDKRIVNLTGVRTVEIGYRGNQSSKIARESLMLTDNLNIIDLQFAVQYLLKNPEDYLYNNRDPDLAVSQVAETAMREVVGRSEVDFVLYEGREQIALDTLALMQDILDRYSTGILVQQVAIQNVQPPDQVQDAFEDAIKARQDRERKINEGEAYANDIVPKARGLSARILEDAEAYRRQKIAIAEGESQRFSALVYEFEIAPEVTRQRLYLDTIEDVMRRTSKVIVDQEEGSNNLLYLPLDRLVGSGGGNQPRSNSGTNLSSGNTQPDNSLTDTIREDIRRRVEERLSKSSQ